MLTASDFGVVLDALQLVAAHGDGELNHHRSPDAHVYVYVYVDVDVDASGDIVMALTSMLYCAQAMVITR